MSLFLWEPVKEYQNVACTRSESFLHANQEADVHSTLQGKQRFAFMVRAMPRWLGGEELSRLGFVSEGAGAIPRPVPGRRQQP